MAKMNVLITAGGTVEKIDEVRSITNFSTGRLGSLIAESFSARGAEVWYVHGIRAALPNCRVNGIAVESALDLKNAVERVLSSERIDAVIHTAAVSDYTVAEVRGSDGKTLERGTKISSTEKELTLRLVQTPKIIASLRKLAPAAIIAGFKLLNKAPFSELESAAIRLMEQNGLDLVLMNDLSTIHGDVHIGYLLNRNHEQIKFGTKPEIAGGIVEAVFGRANG